MIKRNQKSETIWGSFVGNLLIKKPYFISMFDLEFFQTFLNIIIKHGGENELLVSGISLTMWDYNLVSCCSFFEFCGKTVQLNQLICCIGSHVSEFANNFFHCYFFILVQQTKGYGKKIWKFPFLLCSYRCCSCLGK